MTDVPAGTVTGIMVVNYPMVSSDDPNRDMICLTYAWEGLCAATDFDNKTPWWEVNSNGLLKPVFTKRVS